MKVLIVDDHPLVREALAAVIAQLRPLSEVQLAGSAQQAMDVLRTWAPVDLVLLDLRLPDARGMDVLTRIGREYVGTAVVLLLGDLAEPAVKNHVSAIPRALGVNSRTEVVLAVIRLGWTLPVRPPH